MTAAELVKLTVPVEPVGSTPVALYIEARYRAEALRTR